MQSWLMAALSIPALVLVFDAIMTGGCVQIFCAVLQSLPAGLQAKWGPHQTGCLALPTQQDTSPQLPSASHQLLAAASSAARQLPAAAAAVLPPALVALPLALSAQNMHEDPYRLVPCAYAVLCLHAMFTNAGMQHHKAALVVVLQKDCTAAGLPDKPSIVSTSTRE